MRRVIHVCGTMGAGKTTLIRGWMGGIAWIPHRTDDRRLPWGYLSVTHHPPLFLAGAYEEGLQTSGCDTIKDTPLSYANIQQWAAERTVVYEGLFMMNHTRGLALLRAVGPANFHVLRLMTTLTECREGVVARRAAQGNTEPLPARFQDGLEGNDVRARNYAHKMRMAGATVHRVSRDEAAVKLRELTA